VKLVGNAVELVDDCVRLDGEMGRRVGDAVELVGDC